MCFRPPTVDFDDSTCPQCGHENFIGVAKCAKCGASLASGPIGTASAEVRDWSQDAEFDHLGTDGTRANPKAPSAPASKAPVASAPKPPQAPPRQ